MRWAHGAVSATWRQLTWATVCRFPPTWPIAGGRDIGWATGAGRTPAQGLSATQGVSPADGPDGGDRVGEIMALSGVDPGVGFGPAPRTGFVGDRPPIPVALDRPRRSPPRASLTLVERQRPELCFHDSRRPSFGAHGQEVASKDHGRVDAYPLAQLAGVLVEPPPSGRGRGGQRPSSRVDQLAGPAPCLEPDPLVVEPALLGAHIRRCRCRQPAAQVGPGLGQAAERPLLIAVGAGRLAIAMGGSRLAGSRRAGAGQPDAGQLRDQAGVGRSHVRQLRDQAGDRARRRVPPDRSVGHEVEPGLVEPRQRTASEVPEAEHLPPVPIAKVGRCRGVGVGDRGPSEIGCRHRHRARGPARGHGAGSRVDAGDDAESSGRGRPEERVPTEHPQLVARPPLPPLHGHSGTVQPTAAGEELASQGVQRFGFLGSKGNHDRRPAPRSEAGPIRHQGVESVLARRGDRDGLVEAAPNRCRRAGGGDRCAGVHSRQQGAQPVERRTARLARGRAGATFHQDHLGEAAGAVGDDAMQLGRAEAVGVVDHDDRAGPAELGLLRQATQRRPPFHRPGRGRDHRYPVPACHPCCVGRFQHRSLGEKWAIAQPFDGGPA
jgi:hypothetical protein